MTLMMNRRVTLNGGTASGTERAAVKQPARASRFQ
jgi:hypothetical protein